MKTRKTSARSGWRLRCVSAPARTPARRIFLTFLPARLPALQLPIQLTILLTMLVVIGVGAGAIPDAAADPVVNNLRKWHEKERSRFVLDLGEAMSYETFLLRDPLRVVIDLPKVPFRDPLALKKNLGPLVESAHTGTGPNGNMRRFVLVLKRPVNLVPETLGPSGKRGHRIVLNLMPAHGGSSSIAADTAAAQTPPAEILASAAVVQNDTGAPVIDGDGIITGSLDNLPSTFDNVEGAVSGVAESAPAPVPPPTVAKRAPTVPRESVVGSQAAEQVIVIDAGHGGSKPGAVGQRKTREKDVTLQISKILEKKINAIPGLRAVMTRTADRTVGLGERVRIAERNNALVFLSIHADGAKATKANGFSVYALSKGGATSHEAARLATRENNDRLAGGEVISDMDPLVAATFLDLALDTTQSWGIELGKHVIRELGQIGPVHKENVEAAGFMVLKVPQVAALLVETGFITNKGEEKLLTTRAHQEKVADAIVRGVQSFVDDILRRGSP